DPVPDAIGRASERLPPLPSYGDWERLMTRTSLLSRSTSSWLIAALILAAIAAGPHALHAAAGVPDMGFGTDGKVRTDFLGHSTDWAFGVTTQDDGKIIAVGTAL